MRRALIAVLGATSLVTGCTKLFGGGTQDAGATVAVIGNDPKPVVLDVPTVDTAQAMPTTTIGPIVITPTATTSAAATGTTAAAATPGATGAMPFAASQAWLGDYTCAQGRTAVTLRITRVSGNTVSAIFDFRVPSGPTGKFAMSGTYEPSSRHLRLEPGAWIVRPDGYMTVPVDATVSADGKSYRGTIDTQGCSDFFVKL